jgi:hypothetical protein
MYHSFPFKPVLFMLLQLNKALELLKAGKPRYRIVLETDI